jgi:hypothetical protein
LLPLFTRKVYSSLEAAGVRVLVRNVRDFSTFYTSFTRHKCSAILLVALGTGGICNNVRNCTLFNINLLVDLVDMVNRQLHNSVTLRLGPHERTKCVRCNERRDVRCRNKQERRMLRFLLAPLQTESMHRILKLCCVLSNVRHKVRSLQRTYFVRSCRRGLSVVINLCLFGV